MSQCSHTTFQSGQIQDERFKITPVTRIHFSIIKYANKNKHGTVRHGLGSIRDTVLVVVKVERHVTSRRSAKEL